MTEYRWGAFTVAIIILSILLILAVYCAVMMCVWDWRARLIPDVFLFPFLLIGLVLGDQLPWIPGGLGEAVIAGAIGYAVGFFINFLFKAIKRRAKNTKTAGNNVIDPIGLGDIKLLAAGGIWLGINGLSIAIIAACLVGVVWGMRRKQRFVPFAPFFFIGAAAAVGISFL